MNISAIASLSTQLSQQRVGQTAELAVLKKAMQVQAQSAMTLIAALPPPAPMPPSSLPSHLGQNINIVA